MTFHESRVAAAGEDDAEPKKQKSKIIATQFLFPFTAQSRMRSRETRFGQNWPLWQNLTSLWQFFEGKFSIWHNLGPIFAQFCMQLSKFSLPEMAIY